MAEFQIDPRRTPMLPDDRQRVNEAIMTQFRSNAGSIAARASIADGAERERLFDAQTHVLPVFAEYQRQTSSRFPVVLLERLDQAVSDGIATKTSRSSSSCE